MFHDVRLAVRALWRRPVFALSAVVTLALGLGAATATFGVVDRLLLRPLDYPDPTRLVFVSGVLPGDSGPGASLSFAEMADIVERSRSIQAIAGQADSRAMEIAGDQGPQAAHVNVVNTSYFGLLGARATAGRLLTAEDERAPGAHPVAVVSFAFWQTRLGARANVVGSSIRIGDLPFTIVGVMDPAFRDVPFEAGNPATDIWMSSMMSLPAYGPTFLTSRSARVVWGIGRLRDGTTVEGAQRELTAIAADLAREFPETNRSVGWHAERLDLWLFRDARTPFLVVLLAAMSLLAVAALNITGLLVVRMAERTRDLRVRRALGATLLQSLRPVVAEGVVMAAAAAALGLVVAALLLGFVRASAPYVFPRVQTVGLDLRGIVMLVALATLVAGAMAAATVFLMRARDGLALDGARTVTADRRTTRLQRGLVVSEVALSAVLLCGSVLVAQSLGALDRAPLGFNPDGLMTATMELRGDRYRDDASVRTFGDRLLENVRAVSGVEAAFLWGPGRPGRDTWISYILPERLVNVPDPERVMVWRHHVSAGALAAAGIPLRSGREFLPSDREAGRLLAVVSESMARRFWPGQDPVGQRFSFITAVTPRPWFEIVGVAADAAHRRRTYSLRLPEYDYYQLFDQRPERSLTLVTRARGRADSVAAGVREAIGQSDAALPIREMRTFDEHLAEEETSFRFAGWLMAGFAGLTFVLSAAGLYSLIGYLIALRQRELAVRSALGATRATLFRSLLWGGLALGGIGTAGGLIAAWFGSRLLGSLLYGVDPTAAAPYAIVGVAMLTGVLLATALPAARVRSIDPSRSLRES